MTARWPANHAQCGCPPSQLIYTLFHSYCSVSFSCNADANPYGFHYGRNNLQAVLSWLNCARHLSILALVVLPACKALALVSTSSQLSSAQMSSCLGSLPWLDFKTIILSPSLLFPSPHFLRIPLTIPLNSLTVIYLLFIVYLPPPHYRLIKAQIL